MNTSDPIISDQPIEQETDPGLADAVPDPSPPVETVPSQEVDDEPRPTPAGPVESNPFEAAAPGIPENQRINIDMLIDVPVKVAVELGRTELTVREVLELERGSVVELNRVAGDPVDVLVNDQLVAVGEVVVVDDKFGVRISRLITPGSNNGRI